MKVWRGPAVDWLQHRWPDVFAPPWGGEVMMFRGVRVAAITGYPAAAVPWSIINGLADGACRITRLDLCVDVEGYALPMPPSADPDERRAWLDARGEREMNSSDGYTRYKGAKDSELQWRCYLYTSKGLEAKRPWMWREEARAAGVDVLKSWRVEVQARGRLARALAAAQTIVEAWAMLRPRWPEWPHVGPAVAAGRLPPTKQAEVSAASELAERCRRYIASQARRSARRVGLSPEETRDMLRRVSMETLAQLAGCSPDGVVESDHDYREDDPEEPRGGGESEA